MENNFSGGLTSELSIAINCNCVLTHHSSWLMLLTYKRVSCHEIMFYAYIYKSVNRDVCLKSYYIEDQLRRILTCTKKANLRKRKSSQSGTVTPEKCTCLSCRSFWICSQDHKKNKPLINDFTFHISHSIQNDYKFYDFFYFSILNKFFEVFCVTIFECILQIQA